MGLLVCLLAYPCGKKLTDPGSLPLSLGSAFSSYFSLSQKLSGIAHQDLEQEVEAGNEVVAQDSIVILSGCHHDTCTRNPHQR
jgi:hypothetical protein